MLQILLCYLSRSFIWTRSYFSKQHQPNMLEMEQTLLLNLPSSSLPPRTFPFILSLLYSFFLFLFRPLLYFSIFLPSNSLSVTYLLLYFPFNSCTFIYYLSSVFVNHPLLYQVFQKRVSIDSNKFYTIFVVCTYITIGPDDRIKKKNFLKILISWRITGRKQHVKKICVNQHQVFVMKNTNARTYNTKLLLLHTFWKPLFCFKPFEILIFIFQFLCETNVGRIMRRE